MRIGCLGAARIAPPALTAPAHVRGGAILQAVAARDPARAEAFAKAHGFARTEPGYAALVEAKDIDLIYNPLPINLHAEWTIKALQAGKHVLCEKPFVMNIGEAEAVLAAATASGKRVVEAFHYRYHPGFNQMMAWLAEGAIGVVTGITAVFNAPIANRDGTEIRHLPETGGGAFMDLGCYPLSWALSIMGADPVEVQASATLTPLGVDESIRTSLHFEDGVVAELSASMALDGRFAASLTVKGTVGEITFVNPLAPHFGSRLTLDAGDRHEVASVSRISTYTYQLDTVLAALDSGAPLYTEGEAILRQQRTLDRVYESAGLRGLRYR